MLHLHLQGSGRWAPDLSKVELDRFEGLGTHETFGKDRDVRPILRLQTFDLERAIERIDQPRVLDVMTSVKRHFLDAVSKFRVEGESTSQTQSGGMSIRVASRSVGARSIRHPARSGMTAFSCRRSSGSKTITHPPGSSSPESKARSSREPTRVAPFARLSRGRGEV